MAKGNETPIDSENKWERFGFLETLIVDNSAWENHSHLSDLAQSLNIYVDKNRAVKRSVFKHILSQVRKFIRLFLNYLRRQKSKIIHVLERSILHCGIKSDEQMKAREALHEALHDKKRRVVVRIDPYDGKKIWVQNPVDEVEWIEAELTPSMGK